jgi:Protein of unknown function (DUF4229)
VTNGGDPGQTPSAPAPSARRAVLTYNLLRLVLFGVCVGLGWLAGLRSVLLIVAALLVSGVLSWFWLRPQREAMGRAVEQSVERSRVKLAASTAAEDAYVDEALPAPSQRSPQEAAPHEQQ